MSKSNSIKPKKTPATLQPGDVFGRITVLRFAFKKGKIWFFECECSCGKSKTIAGANLCYGIAKSCGCYSAEIASKRFTTHGMTRACQKASEYAVWAAMKRRCTSPRDKRYKNYGGRGITVCRRWSGTGGFQNFISDMGLRPTPKHTLDRINNNGNYCPENCRWATNTVQSRNRRNNRVISIDGESKCLAEWVEQYGTKFDLVKDRLKAGWEIKRALTSPIGPTGKRYGSARKGD